MLKARALIGILERSVDSIDFGILLAFEGKFTTIR